ARDDKDHLLSWPVERRKEFGAVLYADARRCAGAYIDEPPAVPQAWRGRIDRSRDGWQSRTDTGDCRGLLFMQRLQPFGRRPQVEVDIARIDVLCTHASIETGKSG